MTAEILNEQVGKYRLIRKLATGGMAHIFLAEQSGPGGFKKRLVLKRILPHLIDDEKFLQMFQDEARVAAMMNHPNIVQIFELGEDDSSLYIAMEYVAGFNLRAVIQLSNENGIWLAPEYIAKLGSQVCEGLEYAHNFCNTEGRHLNIIHRDISPQNLMLSNQGMVKVVDFGIAKASSNAQETQAGIIKGKLAYMSPEQVKGQVLDRRSDLFSLGIVMYELATHQRPYQGKSDIDMLRAILESKPIPVDSLRPDFPPQLAQIIYRALSKDREERYPSAREFQWDLEQFIQGWGKPISSFQLQELVNKLNELDQQKSDAVENPPSQPAPAPRQPAPAPAVAPPPPPMPSSSSNRAPAPADDFDEDGETMWATDIKIPTKRPDGPSPASQPAVPAAYTPPPTSAAPQATAAAVPTGSQPQWAQWGGPPQDSHPQAAAPPPAPPAPAMPQWGQPNPNQDGGDEWEEDEATVMSPSPLAADMMAGMINNFSQAAPPPPAASYSGMSHNDLDTSVESGVSGSQTGIPNPGYSHSEIPAAPTIMDQPSLDQMNAIRTGNPAPVVASVPNAGAPFGGNARPMPSSHSIPAIPNAPHSRQWPPTAQAPAQQQAPSQLTQPLTEAINPSMLGGPRQAPIRTTSSGKSNKLLIILLTLGIILLAGGIVVYLFVLQ